MLSPPPGVWNALVSYSCDVGSGAVEHEDYWPAIDTGRILDGIPLWATADCRPDPAPPSGDINHPFDPVPTTGGNIALYRVAVTTNRRLDGLPLMAAEIDPCCDGGPLNSPFPPTTPSDQGWVYPDAGCPCSRYPKYIKVFVEYIPWGDPSAVHCRFTPFWVLAQFTYDPIHLWHYQILHVQGDKFTGATIVSCTINSTGTPPFAYGTYNCPATIPGVFYTWPAVGCAATMTGGCDPFGFVIEACGTFRLTGSVA